MGEIFSPPTIFRLYFERGIEGIWYDQACSARTITTDQYSCWEVVEVKKET